MSAISHFSFLGIRRTVNEHRFNVSPDRMDDLRYCYRVMRQAGIRRHMARHIIVAGLGAGRFGDTVWTERRGAA